MGKKERLASFAGGAEGEKDAGFMLPFIQGEVFSKTK